MTTLAVLPARSRSWSASRLGSSLALVRDEQWRSRVLIVGFMLLLHSLACAYYSSLAALHVYVRSEPKATGILNLVGRDILDFFDYVIVASVVLVILHGSAICAFVWLALPRYARRRIHAQGSYNNGRGLRHPESTVPNRHSRWQRILRSLERWDRALERRTGVDSYELLVLVEIGLQTYQANKLSNLVATLWINRLVVFVIVVNCWFMPAVSVAFRKKTPTFVKVVHLALDSILEVVYGMVVPLAIFYPYYRDAMAIFNDNPFMGYYNDTWSVNTVAENRQLYVTSWIDFCAKMTPGVSLFVRLYALRTQHKVHQVSTTTTNSRVKIAPEIARAAKRKSVLHKKRVLIRFMVLWGLAVLAFHIAAASVSVSGNSQSCLLEMRPLGSTQYTCTVLEVSCSRMRISGSKSELDDALSHVDPLRVQGLIFSHCPALAMPPRIKTFPILVSIKIYNCTIGEWGDDAALTALDHPALQILYITRTNLSGIPVGLLSRDFPPLLRDIEFCGTNLTGLPVDLFDTWVDMYYFALELSPGITEFPPALLRANTTIPWLTLSSNAITELPDDLFVTHKYRFFHAVGNPLTRLPTQAGSASATRRMSIAHTGITEIPPSWFASDTYAQHESAVAKSGFILTADHSPLCERLLPNAPTTVSTTAALADGEPRIAWLQLECMRGSPLYYYPLDLEAQWRQPNRE